MAGGRPTKYKEEYCKQIIEFCKDGKSLTAFAASIGVHKGSLDDWAEAHEEFSCAKKTAMSNCEAWWEEQLRLGAWNKYQADNVNVGAVAFVLKARFGWRDKDQTVINNQIDDRGSVVESLRLGVMRKDA